MLSNQQSGQGTSERLHQSVKRISTNFRNRLGGKVKEALTEVKMSGMRKRAAETGWDQVDDEMGSGRRRGDVVSSSYQLKLISWRHH
jgi:hypothetical protein